MSMTDSGYSHSFPAIRGTQAGRTFFVAMCPMKIIPKIFIFNEEEVPPEMRAQRTLNRARIPEIATYLVENPKNYILSALTASIDASDVSFQPYVESGPASNLGVLNVPMEVSILINDGQHRRAAIEEAIKENPAIAQDNIPVLFFIDAGLVRSQQMFADLNKYAVRPSYSLGTLYDHRDASSELARFLANKCLAFIGLTEMEKSTISNRSTKLFTLSGIKHASRALLQKSNTDKISEQEKATARDYWDAVAEQIPDWRRAKDRTVVTSDLRQNYIHAHGVALHALGLIGANLLAEHPKDWKKYIGKLSKIDWSRSNVELWEGRAMVHGRISKATSNVILTSNLIKKYLGLPLKPDEIELESRITK
ncbi:MAG: DNA sulfur modification protein DndB [Gammaproteobacteria bacterium]|nr:DNA sulfur modification protein DndB [Gammaproteobacteria bacterium]